MQHQTQQHLPRFGLVFNRKFFIFFKVLLIKIDIEFPHTQQMNEKSESDFLCQNYF